MYAPRACIRSENIRCENIKIEKFPLFYARIRCISRVSINFKIRDTVSEIPYDPSSDFVNSVDEFLWDTLIGSCARIELREYVVYRYIVMQSTVY